MTGRLDVSVVVCTYNRAERLRDALRSLVRLERDDLAIEVVVVDNNSNDATPSVVDEVSSEAQFPMRRVFEPRQGIVAARNRGVAEARGEWIAFFDDDQLAEPRWLVELLRMARSKHARCVGGAVRLKLSDGANRELSPFVRMLLGESVGMSEPRRYNSRVTPGCGNLLVRRSVFDEVGPFSERWMNRGEDTDLFHRMQAAGIDAWYTPDAVVHHVVPPERLEEEYLVRLSRVMVQGMAEDERRAWGAWLYPFVWAARIGQAACVLWPRWFWAIAVGERERALGARCRLSIACGCIRDGFRLVTGRPVTP